jgi:uncharacterized protein with HEPN domain
MKLEVQKWLVDILDSIRAIDTHLGGQRIFAEYTANRTVKRAVERELEIIGEAVSRIVKLEPDIKISYSRLVIDLRNRIIHAYDNVNDTIIWKIVMIDIPVLEAEVKNLLDQSSAQDG